MWYTPNIRVRSYPVIKLAESCFFFHYIPNNLENLPFLTASYQSLTGRLLWTQILISNTNHFGLSIQSLYKITENRTRKNLCRKACQCTCINTFS